MVLHTCRAAILLLRTYRILVCVGVCMNGAEECFSRCMCVCISMCCMCIWEMLQAKLFLFHAERRGGDRETERKSGWESHTSMRTLEKRGREMCVGGCVQRQELVFLCIISRPYGATNEAGKSLIHPVALALALAWQHCDMTSHFFSPRKKRLNRKKNTF